MSSCLQHGIDQTPPTGCGLPSRLGNRALVDAAVMIALFRFAKHSTTFRRRFRASHRPCAARAPSSQVATAQWHAN